jgi:alpha-beta hydrolase superfamily lysophospholipase
MFGLAIGAAAAGMAVGAGLVTASRAHHKLRLPFEPDELHWARTEDGWELPMGRYRPRGPRAVKEPVVLCHGMGANRFNLDLNETYSVARYLAGHGYETFVIELRGSGLARRYKPGRHYRFRFDDIVHGDLQPLIDKAKEISGAERVLWVGHSKGGVVMYAFCALGPHPDIAGVTAIGSPLIGQDYFPPARRKWAVALSRLMVLDAIYIEPVLRLLAPVGNRSFVRLRYMASSENMDPEVSAWAMANLLGNVATGVTGQFARWIETGRFTSWDGAVDYRARLARSQVPFLLIAGSADLLGPPGSLEAARDAMVDARAAGKVEYLLCGRETGFSCDYGHGDLVLGREAPKEIFPRIEAWLRAHGTRP